MTRILESNALMALLLGAVLLTACILLLNCVRHPTMDAIEWREEIYHVRPGDSLWSVAGAYCPASVDRREWIDEIQALNGLNGSTLHPGQQIIVLAATKKEVQR